MVRRIFILDFMYLWNRVYAIKGLDTGKHVHKTLHALDNSDYYSDKFVVLDGLNSTCARRKILPEYKAGRSDKSKVYDLMNKFLYNSSEDFESVHIIRNNNYEADDVITGIVQRFPGDNKYVYTGDTDLFQLMRFYKTYVGDKFSTKGSLILEPTSTKEALARYKKRYGVEMRSLSYITKCKAFKGDLGDGVPIACPGMRAKTLSALFKNCWNNDEPLSSSVLLSMAQYLSKNGTKKEFINFYEHRNDIIRNYKLTQLGYTKPDVWSALEELDETGEWNGFQII